MKMSEKRHTWTFTHLFRQLWLLLYFEFMWNAPLIEQSRETREGLSLERCVCWIVSLQANDGICDVNRRSCSLFKSHSANILIFFCLRATSSLWFLFFRSEENQHRDRDKNTDFLKLFVCFGARRWCNLNCVADRFSWDNHGGLLQLSEVSCSTIQTETVTHSCEKCWQNKSQAVFVEPIK